MDCCGNDWAICGSVISFGSCWTRCFFGFSWSVGGIGGSGGNCGVCCCSI